MYLNGAGDFPMVVNQFSLSNVEFTLVDSNYHPVRLFSPMFVIMKVESTPDPAQDIKQFLAKLPKNAPTQAQLRQQQMQEEKQKQEEEKKQVVTNALAQVVTSLLPPTQTNPPPVQISTPPPSPPRSTSDAESTLTWQNLAQQYPHASPLLLDWAEASGYNPAELIPRLEEGARPRAGGEEDEQQVFSPLKV
jgi:hypothetical protein